MPQTVVLEARPYRRVILHYHIMKNAGTTIESILEREFGKAFYSVHREGHNGTIDPDVIVETLAANPTALALTSHQFVFPRPEIPFTTIFDCCPIRHPLDRFESLHRYLRRLPPVDAVCELAATSDAATFLRTLLDRFPNFVFNVQTATLGNGSRFRPLSDAHLRTAVSVVENSGLHVVVDRLDESLTVAEFFLNPAFTGLQLHYVPQNVTQAPGTTLGERQDRLREHLGTELFGQLHAFNQLDLRLYETANRELDRRITLVPRFEERLAGFRTRCEAAATLPT